MAKTDIKKAEAFTTAAQNGNVAKLKALLDGGMPVDDLSMGTTALMSAAANGHRKAVDLLLEAGADPHLRSTMNDRYSLLHYAVFGGDPDIVRLMLGRGLDVNVRSSQGMTPLLSAVENFFLPSQKKLKVARVLVEAGADVNAKAKNGRSALDFAWKDEPIRKLLFEAGSEPAHREKVRANPRDPETFVEAASAGDVAIVRAMLDAGVEIDARNKEGYTALQQAAWFGRGEVFDLLHEAGADLHVKDKDRAGLLHFAAAGGDRGVVQKLLTLGFNVNAADRKRFTPLMAAAEKGRLDVVNELLAAGADVRARGKFIDKQQTAAQIADQMFQKEIAKLLRKAERAAGAVPDATTASIDAVDGFQAAAEKPAFQALLKTFGRLLGAAPKRWRQCPGVYQCRLPRDSVAALTRRYATDRDLKAGLADSDTVEARLYLLLDRLQKEVRRAGFHLIANDSQARLGKLLLFPTADKYAVLAALETNAANYGTDTQAVIAWLRDMEKKNPFDLTACGHDFVEGEFRKPVVGPKELAKRMIEFCPDLDDGESDTPVDDLSRWLKDNQGFFFWWD